MLRALPLLIVLLALPAVAADPANRVAWRSVGELAIHPERHAPASAVSLNEAKLAAEIAATIIEIPVEVGQVVPRGALLARLDPRDYELALAGAQAALQAARARLALAESQLRRARELAGKGFISPEAADQRATETDVARAEVASAQVRVDAARRDLGRAELRAPYPAIVTARNAHVGERVAPGTPLVSVVDTSRIEVAALVQAGDVYSLRAARAPRFESLGRSYALRLLRVSPAIERESRNAEARLAFTRDAAPPGADGRLAWLDPAPHLPPEALVRREGRLGVFVLEGQQARFVPLPGAQEGRPVPATLPREALVATEGRHLLSDGQPQPAPAR